MPKRQSTHSIGLPQIWLISDARNDSGLERALKRLPHGSGLIFRHYHLPPAERRARFAALARIARQRGHCIALSAAASIARSWGADAAYGPPRLLARGPALRRLATAHSLREVAEASRMRADAVLLSPAFATRSHPGAQALGPVRFRLIAARARCPMIALGGMNSRNARRLGTAHWAAVDGLCDEATREIP